MVRAILAVLVCTTAQADYGSTFGLGSRTAALSNSTSFGEDPYLVYTQPAAMSRVLLDFKREILAGYSLLGASTSFKPIDGVITQNDTTSDRVGVGNTDLNYKDVWAQEVGLVVGTLEPLWNLALGLTVASPMQQSFAIDTGESHQPEYLLYRSRLQRPQVDLATSVCPDLAWCFGLGGHLSYGLTANANVFLQTNPDRPSSARFASTLKPRLNPYFGGMHFYDRGSTGLVVRAPSKSEASLRVDASARAFGSLAALDLSYLAQSMLFYDPWSFEWGNDFKLTDHQNLSLKLIYQLWHAYHPPTLLIEEPTSTGIAVTPTNSNSPAFQNTFSPRVGYEHALDSRWTLRGGYGFQPSILKDPTPEGADNYLDPPKHLFSAGGTFQASKAAIDLALFYHLLKSDHVTKNSPTQIGAPGYDTGGHTIGGGITLRLSL